MGWLLSFECCSSFSSSSSGLSGRHGGPRVTRACPSGAGGAEGSGWGEPPERLSKARLWSLDSNLSLWLKWKVRDWLVLFFSLAICNNITVCFPNTVPKYVHRYKNWKDSQESRDPQNMGRHVCRFQRNCGKCWSDCREEKREDMVTQPSAANASKIPVCVKPCSLWFVSLFGPHILWHDFLPKPSGAEGISLHRSSRCLFFFSSPLLSRTSRYTMQLKKKNECTASLPSVMLLSIPEPSMSV